MPTARTTRFYSLTDTDDRLITKVTPEGTLNYTYDAASNVTSISSSNANGASVSYTYDSLNRLSTAVHNRLPSGHNTTSYVYDTANNLVTATYPNGLQSTFSYDKMNRLTSLATSVSGYDYQLDPTGNRTSATEQTGRALTWSYDGIYRLTNEAIASDPAGGNGAVAYGLDPVGNRLSASSTLASISSVISTYGVDDLMAAETYDANGNTLTSGGRNFAYDSENRLTSMNGGAVRIVYDGFGNRVAETAGGVTTKYLVEDDVNPTGLPQVFDEIVNGIVTRTYTYGLQRIDEDQVINNVWTPSFYGYDGGGSVRQLTSLAGTVTDTYNYDAFGNLLNSTGSTPNSYLYRGEQYDSDLALYYLRARYYNPATGRFLSRDPESGEPIVPRTLHKYLYVGADPINYSDPRGRDLFEYAIRANAAVPEARLIDIYGCVADASLTAVDLIINPTISAGSALGGGAAVIGCVALTPGLSELAETGSTVTKKAIGFIKLVGTTADWGSCALDVKEFVNGLNDLLIGTPDGIQITDAITELTGCVGDMLDYLLTHPGQTLQGLGL